MLNTQQEPGVPSRRGFSLSKALVLIGIIALGVGAVWTVGRWTHFRAGHVVARNAWVCSTTAEIGARVEGRVREHLCRPGQHVVAGTVLVRLDDEHVRARVATAEAQVDLRKQELRVEREAIKHERRRLTVEIDHAKARVVSSEAEVEAAQANESRWRAEHAMYAKLTAGRATARRDVVIAESERDRAVALVASARSRADEARARLASARAALAALGVRESAVGVFEARIAAARAARSAAQAELQATVIRAPADGWIVKRNIEAGGSCRVGDPIVLMRFDDQTWVEAWVDESELNKFGIGNRVLVALSAYPGEKLQGRVEAVGLMTDAEMFPGASPAAGPRARTDALVGIRVRLEQHHPQLVAGLTGVVGIARGGSDQGQPTVVPAVYSHKH